MKEFQGPKELVGVYTNMIENLSFIYNEGKSICLCGPHGVGKTTVATNIIKFACLKNYSAIYTTLSDIVSTLIDAPYESKFLARKELMTADFLVLDEMDSRWVNEGSADLFGKIMESIFRTRHQNKLPTIMCSNSPNPLEMFNGAIKQSIDSIMSGVKIIPVFGKDYRKNNEKSNT